MRVASTRTPTYEPDLAVVEVDQPMVREGDAVGASPDIVEHLTRAGEWALGIHHPFGRPRAR